LLTTSVYVAAVVPVGSLATMVVAAKDTTVSLVPLKVTVGAAPVGSNPVPWTVISFVV